MRWRPSFTAGLLALVACSGAGKGGFETPAGPDAGTAPEPDASTTGTFGGDDPKAHDDDHDGYPVAYDCNDHDPNVNRGAYDVAGNGVDEDCSGTPDDEITSCDDALDIAGPDPYDGAKAIGLCKRATDTQMWGVVESAWVTPTGGLIPEPLGKGVLASFGANAPRAGKRMVALSSGSAREPGDPGYHFDPRDDGWDKLYASPAPSGYPRSPPSCAGSGQGDYGGSRDGAALRVRVRVPSNAKSLSFQHDFFTREYPKFVCTDYDDFFVAMMDPVPAGLVDGNIAFDQDNNPIGVNTTLLQVCVGATVANRTFACPLGDALLAGTGFETHAATGWLTTTTPVDAVRGKVITLVWAIWDQGDGRLDSTALVDDFAWSIAQLPVQTTPSPR